MSWGGGVFNIPTKRVGKVVAALNEGGKILLG